MKLDIFVIENTWLKRDWSDFGWGNGYVVIPKGHELYNKDYDYTNDSYDLSVHGGLTYSGDFGEFEKNKETIDSQLGEGYFESHQEDWVLGFDTAHGGDTLEKWSKINVLLETKRFAKQIEQLK